jgi:hypothetical protein
MVQATEPSGSGDFPGDEFANNLFSDLAPLLTLFGEQVTKQFLSMSMGWADNLLLAMGPLGILTIVVSAIRVGGVRQLKALVGRARESMSTVEQELLSSTSPDVCELWSGKEIVRTIGSPAGMKNLIVTTREEGNLDVVDLRTAVLERIVHPPHKFDWAVPDVYDLMDELRDAPPNLALNVENATVPTWRLYLWALLGVALQLAAIVVPGVATYCWKWEKAGRPVALYGYPCFLVGTGLVIIGIMTCGHVIEGTTAEQNFSLDSMTQVVRLQRSCTVGDQHFPSFAIYNSPNDLLLRTSRLRQQKSSFLAATAAAVTVVGYIVQFVGLRTLHWSATILQLSVTILMAGVRAYIRRGLASNPVYQELLEGHETACLALRLLQLNANKTMWEPTLYPPPIWEVQTLHVFGGENMNDSKRAISEWRFKHGNPIRRLEALFPELESTTPSGLEHSLASDGVDELPDSGALKLWESIHKLMPQHDHAVDVAERLAKAIERLATTFASSGIEWTEPANRPFETTAYKWHVPVTAWIHPGNKKTTAARFVVEPGPKPDSGPRPWVLKQQSCLRGVLALWLCTLEERTRVTRRISSSGSGPSHGESDRRSYISAFQTTENWNKKNSLRVVARDDSADPMVLQSWLGKHIYSTDARRGGGRVIRINPADTTRAGYCPWPVFGAFLSSKAL